MKISNFFFFPILQVRGPGVVGVQPIVSKDQEFEYTSFAELQSRKGTMEGKYHMIATGSGDLFDVEVGPFALGP